MRSVLFVCLGNICRSPMAEAALRIEAEARGMNIVVDSAGTGDWHVGRPPDPRTPAAAIREGNVDISALRARQVTMRDYLEYDLIVAMDRSNLADLQAMGGDGPAQIQLLMDFVPGREGDEVADPYTGDESDFTICWREVCIAARHLAEFLVKNQ